MLTGNGFEAGRFLPGFRRCGRGLRRLAAALLVALAAALPPATAQAQTSTLVSNAGQSSDDQAYTPRTAQGFTTGNHAAGYLGNWRGRWYGRCRREQEVAACSRAGGG